MKTKCKHVKILNDRGKKTHKVANELNEPGVGERNQTKCINRGGDGGGGVEGNNSPRKTAYKEKRVGRRGRQGRG